MTSKPDSLPVVVIGAGPVGLSAAAHLVERGLTPVILERGSEIAASIREWAHVPLFSPWKFNIDPAARRLLESQGWQAPQPEHVPTGAELIADYLAPLATTPQLAPHIRTDARVIAVGRRGISKMRTVGRERHPLFVRVETPTGIEDIEAAAILDASGTWTQPNLIGASGFAAPGEAESARYITGGLPDVLGKDRGRFSGKRTLVIGMGHSAANTLLALVDLAQQEPNTEIIWGIRGRSARRLYGSGSTDELPARGLLGTRLKEAVDRGIVTLVKDFTVTSFTSRGDMVQVEALNADGAQTAQVHNVVAATGFRPDLEMLREVRLELDHTIEAPVKLGPLIDPNFHSCGTVAPHGAEMLAHPEENFYIVGMKSYGRAPTFLLATGYEQARSVVAAIAGDHEAANRVELTLPSTGVCSTDNGIIAKTQGLELTVATDSERSSQETAQQDTRAMSPVLLLEQPQQSCCAAAE